MGIRMVGSGLSFALQSLCACVAALTLGVGEAHATGEGCGLFDPCAHSHDYCRFVDLFTSICTERGDAGEGCSGLFQGTCKDGLACDIIGECRHSPSRSGEPCGIGVPCASGLTCSADIGGRCEAPGQAGDSCSGIGQGSCAAGLVCDANRTCRHDPPQTGEPCGIGVPCAGSLVCSADIAGVCETRGGVGDSCSGIGQGSCLAGLVCDLNRTCRHDPPELGEPCGIGVSCAGDLVCLSPVAGVCEARGQAGEFCLGIGQGTCEGGLVCDALLECRHSPPQLGEPCGLGVPCVPALGCSAEIAGRCEPRDVAGETCSGVGQGSCEAGLVCDANRTCRHDPSQRGEPCGIGVPCAGSLVCSADIAGTCGDRGGAGDGCSGIGQGSCADGLVCDLLRTCRHDPPQLDEPCGPFVPCDDGLFCQGFTQVCKEFKTVGEGCSAFNPCREGLACDPCFTDGCDYPLQCFPNANQGAIDQQTCLALYSPGLHQTAYDLGLATTWAAGDGFAVGVAEAQEFGVVYGPDGMYGCFTTLCGGISIDVSISAFVSVGFYTGYDVVAGSSTAFVEGVGAGVVSFSTSQIYARNSLDPFDIVGFPLFPIGTEDQLALTISPDDIVIPFNPGVYICETVVDTVIGGAGQAAAPICGNGVVDPGEACDDGNLFDGDGCSGICTLEALCGNGTVDAGEGCDDGNTTNGDGCSAACQVEPRCGDGNLDLGEECDDGNTADGDGCSAICTLEPSCGDGFVDAGEACDDGNHLDGDGCSAICTVEPFCGDGFVDAGEACDDGNPIDGDGCSAICTVEAPPKTGDLDGDGDTDVNDVRVITGLRGATAGACDGCDLDNDGLITIGDARAAVLLCTRPRCATQ